MTDTTTHDVPGIEAVTTEDVLAYYDGPLLSSVLDASGRRYVAFEADSHLGRTETWYVAAGDDLLPEKHAFLERLLAMS